MGSFFGEGEAVVVASGPSRRGPRSRDAKGLVRNAGAASVAMRCFFSRGMRFSAGGGRRPRTAALQKTGRRRASVPASSLPSFPSFRLSAASAFS